MVKSKSSKVSKGSIRGIDRISNLPDNLISKILTLLPTKCAVATSILSTRWRFSWTSITNLDFDSSCSGCNSTYMITMKRDKFIHFVNRVLLLLNPPSMQTFRLKCKRENIEPYIINSWVNDAFEHTVQELDLYLQLEDPTELPLGQISCNVVVLKLKGNIGFDIPVASSVSFPNLQTLHLHKVTFVIGLFSSVSFPNLKILHLNYVKYANEYSFQKILASCPVLDDLVIKKGYMDNVMSHIISIPSLSKFSFSLTFKASDDYLCYLKLDTPALEYLHIEDFLSCEYLPMKKFNSLVQANVKFVLKFEHDDNIESSVIKFIGNLSNVKFLSIEGDPLQGFWAPLGNTLPYFNNIIRLEIETHQCKSDSYYMINNVLVRMDNLEHLVVNVYCICDSHRQSWWDEPPYVPNCLWSRLTTITFNYRFVDCCDQLEMLKYFLKNAEVLQLLRVTTFNPKINYDFLEKIPTLPRRSRTCQVAINSF